MSGVAFALCFILPFVFAGLWNSDDDDEPADPPHEPPEDPPLPPEEPPVEEPPTEEPPTEEPPKEEPKKDAKVIFDDFGGDVYPDDDGVVIGSDHDDILFGGLQGEDGDASVDAGVHNDVLKGKDGDDCIFAGVGDDTLHGGEGDDEMYGGDGDDWLSYEYAAGGVVVDLEAGTATGEGNDTFHEIEKLRASEHADTIYGSAEMDYIHAGDGNDLVYSSDGDDMMTGGDGDHDTISYANASGSVTVNLEAETAIGHGSDTVEDFENVEGSAFDDILNGDDADNLIAGGEGDDTIDGGDGMDTLLGGEGADIFVAGSGDEIGDFNGTEDFVDLSAYYDTLEDAQMDLDTNGYLTQVGTDGLTLTGAMGTDLTSENTNLGVASFTETTDVSDMPPDVVQIGTETTVNGTLSDDMDRDAFEIALQAGETYTINLSGVDGGGGSLEDPFLWLFDEDGNVMETNDNVSGTNMDAQIVFTPTETGTYYITADSAAGSPVSTSTYTLQVTH